ncbi:Carbohydrate transport and metabolism [Salix suchowensis]|nr:Carbohydrate transport and metabolism [Salix suchowensis]
MVLESSLNSKRQNHEFFLKVTEHPIQQGPCTQSIHKCLQTLTVIVAASFTTLAILTVTTLVTEITYSETAVKPLESILATEIEWLNSIKADLVVSDVVPVACRAAADAGIRSVCVTNFR